MQTQQNGFRRARSGIVLSCAGCARYCGCYGRFGVGEQLALRHKVPIVERFKDSAYRSRCLSERPAVPERYDLRCVVLPDDVG